MHSMHEQHADASCVSIAESCASAYATDGRTNELTQMHKDSSDHSPSVTPAGGPKRFFTYVVVWPVDDIVKVGFAGGAHRWKKFMGCGMGGNLHVLAEFPTEDLARTYEALLHAILRYVGVPAFASKDEALRYLGVGNGWTECFWLSDLSCLYALPLPPCGVLLTAPTLMQRTAEREVSNAALLTYPLTGVGRVQDKAATG